MQFSSVSTHLCRPKNVIKIGSLFVSDLRAVIHDTLSSRFQRVQSVIPKHKVIITDPIFYGKSIQEQHKLVMDLLPENIRDEVEFETFSVEVDRTIRRVQIRKAFSFDSKIVTTTPQFMLDLSVMYFNYGIGALASETAWLSCNLQIKNLLMNYFLDAQHHGLKNNIVDYFMDHCCKNKNLSKKLDDIWSLCGGAHSNSYNENQNMHQIWRSIIASKECSNVIAYIYENEYFNGFDLLKWLANDKFYLNKMIVNYDEENPIPQAKQLYHLKEVLLMKENNLINFIENFPAKLKERGADVEILEFKLEQAKERLNVIKKGNKKKN